MKFEVGDKVRIINSKKDKVYIVDESPFYTMDFPLVRVREVSNVFKFSQNISERFLISEKEYKRIERKKKLERILKINI
jgi:hypothetical protein